MMTLAAVDVGTPQNEEVGAMILQHEAVNVKSHLHIERIVGDHGMIIAMMNTTARESRHRVNQVITGQANDDQVHILVNLVRIHSEMGLPVIGQAAIVDLIVGVIVDVIVGTTVDVIVGMTVDVTVDTIASMIAEALTQTLQRNLKSQKSKNVNASSKK